ncbi:hypothetical protein COMNV_00577 [Commensalibacter sp. Nvir]|uniref:hypothetical protein n=1 Tax=Commensalibacter sp. Nvir TaxID=3069817 RepID=UPI002D616AE1|nr:hypothetical protein COMNV_00577 [Commensalibacter sp. Nvir]
MARRNVDIKIEEKGRDQGKLFKITEMSALDTEAWASRAINAILRNVSVEHYQSLFPLIYSYVSGVNNFSEIEEKEQLSELTKTLENGQTVFDKPLEALALYFANSFFTLPYDDLIQVGDPLLNCCSIYLNPGQSDLTDPIKNNINQYIEETSTLYILKREVFKLHTDFFIKATLPFLKAAQQAHKQE